ncbi:MAG: glycosyltransferase family 4 protein [Chloroflexi bacterium]|nr:glycosyltransferase family 4 protein [Chloroflexota bacterium]
MVAPTSFFSDYGCHVRILEEIWTLQQAGHHLTLCTYHMGNDVAGVKIERSLDVPWRKGVQVGSSRHKLYFDAALGLKTIQIALKVKPDIIHAHLHEGALIGWMAQQALQRLGHKRPPLIFDFQGSLTSEMVDHNFLRPNGPFYRPTRKLEKIINGMADRIVTSSYNGAEILRRDFSHTAEKVVTVADRVNASRFRPAISLPEREACTRLKQELGIPPNHKVVVYLGLLARHQGTNVLLEAAHLLKDELPEVHFVIMGYPGVDSYRELAAYLGLEGRVVFPGRIPYEDAPRYLAIGDVAVSPKMSLTEGAGKISNYMAMGLPVVASDVPVSHEILGELGLYAEPGNARLLADRLKEALTNDALSTRLGEELRAKAIAEMGWEGARCQFEQIYKAELEKQREPNQIITPAADSANDFYEEGFSAEDFFQPTRQRV